MTNKSSTKKLELALVLFLIIFSFFAGVSYSEAVKDHAGWLFEPKEEEVELPDLSKTSIQPVSVVDENGENINQVDERAINENPVNNEISQTEKK